MIDMIGVGPFITMPLIIAAMGGPQAMLGWIFGAVLVMCDGLCWAELGASMPQSGGPYNYLKEIYGPNARPPDVVSFHLAADVFGTALDRIGSIGFAGYATYAFPALDRIFYQGRNTPLPLLGDLTLNISASNARSSLFSWSRFRVFLLYRKITIIEKLGKFLWVGVMITIVWVIFAGVTHFDPKVAFDFPPDAFTLKSAFFLGLGAALLVSVYDYWGYYNVNFFAGEVKEPEKTIPRAIIFSILAVAVIYIVMNISILGVIPWREFSETANSDVAKIHDLGIYGTALRPDGRYDRDRSDNVDRVCDLCSRCCSAIAGFLARRPRMATISRSFESFIRNTVFRTFRFRSWAALLLCSAFLSSRTSSPRWL